MTNSGNGDDCHVPVKQSDDEEESCMKKINNEDEDTLSKLLHLVPPIDEDINNDEKNGNTGVILKRKESASAAWHQLLGGLSNPNVDAQLKGRIYRAIRRKVSDTRHHSFSLLSSGEALFDETPKHSSDNPNISAKDNPLPLLHGDMSVHSYFVVPPSMKQTVISTSSSSNDISNLSPPLSINVDVGKDAFVANDTPIPDPKIEKVFDSGLKLPFIRDFNKLFKRGYTVMVWIRAIDNGEDKDRQQQSDNNKDSLSKQQRRNSTSSATSTGRRSSIEHRSRRKHSLDNSYVDVDVSNNDPRVAEIGEGILFRMCSSARIPSRNAANHQGSKYTGGRARSESLGNSNNVGSGIEVRFLSRWERSRAVAGMGMPGDGNGDGNKRGHYNILSTTIGVCAPLTNPLTHPAGIIKAPLTLVANQWHLLSITHSVPYLKRPQMVISVDGNTLMDLEYPYPNLVETDFPVGKSGAGNMLDVMDDVVLFKGLKEVGIQVAGVEIYGESIPRTVLSLCAELGPNAPLALVGHCPPVSLNRLITSNFASSSSSNSNNGSSGSNNSPTVQHAKFGFSHHRHHHQAGSTAISYAKYRSVMQRYVGAALYSYQPRNIQSLGVVDNRNGKEGTMKRRLQCPNTAHDASNIGSTDNVRYGLAQPRIGSSSSLLSAKKRNENHFMILRGKATVVINHDYLEAPKMNKNSITSNVLEGSLHLLWEHPHDIVPLLLLPIHLSLPPPNPTLQPHLLSRSKILLSHVSNNISISNTGSFKSSSPDWENLALAIELLAVVLSGSACAREWAVQENVVYSLANLVRRILLLQEQQEPSSSSSPTLSQMLSSIDDTKSEIPTGTDTTPLSRNVVSPSLIPPRVMQAIIAFIHACCGPAYLTNPPPTHTSVSIVSSLTSSPHLDNINGTRITSSPSGSPGTNSGSTASTSMAPEGAIHVRRFHLLAIQCLFGLALDVDLYSKDFRAANAILESVVERYCFNAAHKFRSMLLLSTAASSDTTTVVKERVDRQHKPLSEIKKEEDVGAPGDKGGGDSPVPTLTEEQIAMKLATTTEAAIEDYVTITSATTTATVNTIPSGPVAVALNFDKHQKKSQQQQSYQHPVLTPIRNRGDSAGLSESKFLRDNLTVQNLLDLIRQFDFHHPSYADTSKADRCSIDLHKSATTDPDNATLQNSVANAATVTAEKEQYSDYYKTLQHNLSLILYTLLYSSLCDNTDITRNEHDMSSIMAALSEQCRLGSFVTSVILKALDWLLLECDGLYLMANNQYEGGSNSSGLLSSPTKGNSGTAAPFFSSNSSHQQQQQQQHRGQHRRKEQMTQQRKWNAIRGQMEKRLARNMLLSQYHTVVAPILLSRLVVFGGISDHNTGDFGSSNGKLNKYEEGEQKQQEKDTFVNKEKDGDSVAEISSYISSSIVITNTDKVESRKEWREQWKIVFYSLLWLNSMTAHEGEVSSLTSGKFVLASAKAGILDSLVQRAPTMDTPPSKNDSSSASNKHYTDGDDEGWTIFMLRVLPIVISQSSSSSGGNKGSKKSSSSSKHYSGNNASNTTVVTTSDRLRVFWPMLPALVSCLAQPYHHGGSNIINRSMFALRNLESSILILDTATRSTFYPNGTTVKSQSKAKLILNGFLTHCLSSLGMLNVCVQDEHKKSKDMSSTPVLTSLQSCFLKLLDIMSSLLYYNILSIDGEIAESAIQKIGSLVPLGGESANTFVPIDETLIFDKQKQQLTFDSDEINISRSTLCRFIACVFEKAAATIGGNNSVVTTGGGGRSVTIQPLNAPDATLCLSLSRLVALIHDKELLSLRMDDTNLKALLVSICSLLKAGRETMGWSQQLASFQDHHANNSTPQNDSNGKVRSVPSAPVHRLAAQSSKAILPLLQPLLKVLLSSLYRLLSSDDDEVVGNCSNVSYDSDNGNSPSLLYVLNNIDQEIRKTLPVALIGFKFPNARDTCFMALSYLRSSILRTQSSVATTTSTTITSTNHENIFSQSKRNVMARDLVWFVSKEMEARYEREREFKRRRNINSLSTMSNDDSAMDSDTDVQQLADEEESVRAVEQLFFGGDPFERRSSRMSQAQKSISDLANLSPSSSSIPSFSPKNKNFYEENHEDEDFIMYTDAMSILDSGTSMLNFECYSGLGQVLSSGLEIEEHERLHYEKQQRQQVKDDTSKELFTGDENAGISKDLPAASEGPIVPFTKKSDVLLKLLDSYLDMWDEAYPITVNQAAAITMITNLDTQNCEYLDVSPKKQEQVVTIATDKIPVALSIYEPYENQNDGTLGASDLIAQYMELSTVERQRFTDYTNSYLPSRRIISSSIRDTNTWQTWFEFNSSDEHYELVKNSWERAVQDGGRDVYSRLITAPVVPQFPRSIPDYMDHSVAPVVTKDDHIEEREDTVEPESTPIPTKLKRLSTIHDAAALYDPDLSEEENEECDDLDVSKRSMRVRKDYRRLSTQLKIVDVTKISLGESLQKVQDATSIDGTENNDDEGVSLGFPDDATFEAKRLEDADDGATTAETSVTSSSTTPTTGNKSSVEKQSQPSTPSGDDSVAVATASFPSPAAIQHHSAHGGMSVNPFSQAPDGSLGIGESVVMSWDGCIQVRAEGNRKGTILLTQSHVLIEYDGLLYEGEVLELDEMRSRRTETRKVATRLQPNDTSLEEDEPTDEELLGKDQFHAASMRPRLLRISLAELSQIYLRRYRLRDSALELFLVPSGGGNCTANISGNVLASCGNTISVFVDFGPGHVGIERRDEAANMIMKRAPNQCIKQWPDRSVLFLVERVRRLAAAWADGKTSNFDYLLQMNILAGRSFNDLCQYPVMPWVLSNYTSTEIPDLTDKSNFRDLSKPMGALNEERLSELVERFETFIDPIMPSFMYGSHYSTSAGVVLHFLVRLHPFSGLHRQLQSGHFDVADRLFASIPRTWDMCTGISAAEVKELTPEWYCNPSFLRNDNEFALGTSQDGELLDNVVLPPWASNSPEKFVEVMRCALESDICRDMLPDWIDLIFGYKQQGPESVKANNVFFYLTYYGSVDVASIEDESLRTATELQIAHFGQCPMQLLWRPHVRSRRHVRSMPDLTEMLGLFDLRESSFPSDLLSGAEQSAINDNDDYVDIDSMPISYQLAIASQKSRELETISNLPFLSAPLSSWVHLHAPPPGPHAALISLRLAGTDRCLAIDSQGVFHSFRWAWNPDVSEPHTTNKSKKDKNSKNYNNDFLPAELDADNDLDQADAFQKSSSYDSGCFVAQRELPNFRSIPRLPYIKEGDRPRTQQSLNECQIVCAISRTLFAGHTLLLCLSDGDGNGALSMQFVDPARGIVKCECILPAVHSAAISVIAMDPIAPCTGGGAGGELTIVGSEDGTATIWRFISSQYLPLRPRQRLGGHQGRKICSVALSGLLNACVSVSERRCCLFNLGSGLMLRSFQPPVKSCEEENGTYTVVRTVFADTPAVALTTQGFIVLVCQTTITTKSTVSNEDNATENTKTQITLELFSLEGAHCGSMPLEAFRGIPHKIISISSDGITGCAVMVCCNGGVSIHRVSALYPLVKLDEWRTVSGDGSNLLDTKSITFDVDIGPSIHRPVVAAAACSSGVLRLHALPGISEWSEEKKRRSKTVSAAVGNVISKALPAHTIKKTVGNIAGIGTRVIGFGKEVGKEAMTDVKERGVGGFFGNVLGKLGKGKH